MAHRMPADVCQPSTNQTRTPAVRHTSITSGERNSSLGASSVVRFLPRHITIYHLNNRLERGKFHHGVRNLSTPQRVQPFVKPVWPNQKQYPNQSQASCSPSSAFLSRDCRDSTEGPRSEGRNCRLHSHLHGLKWTKRYISDEFGRSAGAEIQPGLVFVCVLFPSQVRVEFHEILVSAVFECTLRLNPMSTVIAVSPPQSIPNSQRTLDPIQ